MKKPLLIISFCLSFFVFASAQNEDKYMEVLQKMFVVSGTESTFQAALSQMFSMFKNQAPNADDQVWKELESEFAKTSMQDLVVLFAPVYEKYLTIDDLQELIKFYESPVGKKFAKQTPNITQESMQVGQEWGMQIGEKVTQKLKEKGY